MKAKFINELSSNFLKPKKLEGNAKIIFEIQELIKTFGFKPVRVKAYNDDLTLEFSSDFWDYYCDINYISQDTTEPYYKEKHPEFLGKWDVDISYPNGKKNYFINEDWKIALKEGIDFLIGADVDYLIKQTSDEISKLQNKLTKLNSDINNYENIKHFYES